ncbi:MAG TPA: single-stranded DNA-binding protein [Hanamia sp.]
MPIEKGTGLFAGIIGIVLIGNTGKDPEYKTLEDGTPVAKLTIAIAETYRQKNGETTTNTEWHPVIVWRGLATFANQYIHKGSLLYIEGKLRHRQYEDKEGQEARVLQPSTFNHQPSTINHQPSTINKKKRAATFYSNSPRATSKIRSN